MYIFKIKISSKFYFQQPNKQNIVEKLSEREKGRGICFVIGFAAYTL